MRVWALKNCDSCRRALADLASAGQQPEVVDIRKSGLAAADVQRFHARLGAALVNRRSTTWRGLSEAERAGDPVALILAHPTLMKRPVIEAGGQITIGWSAETRALWLGKS
jgi:arsenate reductase